jgi:hypothetical protein
MYVSSQGAVKASIEAIFKATFEATVTRISIAGAFEIRSVYKTEAQHPSTSFFLYMNSLPQQETQDQVHGLCHQAVRTM